jgi:glycosyltransferase involved in cell wall biosynthesis
MIDISTLKIAFVGNSNNMPYVYAKAMIAQDLDVTLFLDRPKSYLLDRPESNDPEHFESGLPSWIVELKLIFPSRYISSSFPSLFYIRLLNKLRKYDVIIFNGNLISLGQFIEKGKVVINIFSGSDLDIAADYKSRKMVVQSIHDITFRKFVPKVFIEWLFPRFIANQRKGIRRADLVNYYPTGMFPEGDKLLLEIMGGKQFVRMEHRGTDCSKFNYQTIDPIKETFTILSFVRFYYLNNCNANKKNDIMINGISKFLSRNKLQKPVEIIFFEKGNDLNAAKKLCEEMGLSPYVKWVGIVSLHELTEYMKMSDVVFDQLGDQFIGGGLHSMLVGRPLIANGRPDVFRPLLGVKSPVCQATNEEEVANWLDKLYNDKSLVIELGKKCRQYVLDHHNLDSTIEYLIHFIESKKV